MVGWSTFLSNLSEEFTIHLHHQEDFSLAIDIFDINFDKTYWIKHMEKFVEISAPSFCSNCTDYFTTKLSIFYYIYLLPHIFSLKTMIRRNSNSWRTIKMIPCKWNSVHEKSAHPFNKKEHNYLQYITYGTYHIEISNSYLMTSSGFAAIDFLSQFLSDSKWYQIWGLIMLAILGKIIAVLWCGFSLNSITQTKLKL